MQPFAQSKNIFTKEKSILRPNVNFQKDWFNVILCKYLFAMN